MNLKRKILKITISLLYGFITTNLLFCDVMHNDIHKGNWKIKIDDQRIDIYNTHLDAGNSSVDIATREKQISHIVYYILIV